MIRRATSPSSRPSHRGTSPRPGLRTW
jgi:hypothetical protein